MIGQAVETIPPDHGIAQEAMTPWEAWEAAMIRWLMEIAETLEAGDLHLLSVNKANGEDQEACPEVCQEACQVLLDHKDPDPHGIWSLLIFQDVTTLMTEEPAIGANLNKEVEMEVAVLLPDLKVSKLF